MSQENARKSWKDLPPMLIGEDKVQIIHAHLIRQKVINVVCLLQDSGQDMRETMTLIYGVRYADPWLKFYESDPADTIGNLWAMLCFDLYLSQTADLIHDVDLSLVRYVNTYNPEAKLDME